MTTLKNQLATDVAAAFTDNFTDTARIGRKTYSGFFESITKSEEPELGGPYPQADTRLHLKTSDLAEIDIQQEVEDPVRNIRYRVTFSIESPDGTLLSINLKRI